MMVQHLFQLLKASKHFPSHIFDIITTSLYVKAPLANRCVRQVWYQLQTSFSLSKSNTLVDHTAQGLIFSIKPNEIFLE